MIVFPNAKINLGLDILAKRPDGYHEVATVMLPVGWTDILEVVPGKGEESTLTVTGRYVDCPVEKNLVKKALRRFEQELEIPSVDIYLHKVIPDGAGLGGGSADAAFTLKALNELFALGYDDERLAAMAADLGADCPFFIYNRPMLATGIGTDLSPIQFSLRGYSIAIVKPQVHVSTKEAYAGVTPRRPEIPLQEAIAAFSLSDPNTLGAVSNDFEASVFPKFPAIAQVKEQLLEMGALYAAMSGSGAAVFGLFAEGDKLAERIADRFHGMAAHVEKF